MLEHSARPPRATAHAHSGVRGLSLGLHGRHFRHPKQGSHLGIARRRRWLPAPRRRLGPTPLLQQLTRRELGVSLGLVTFPVLRPLVRPPGRVIGGGYSRLRALPQGMVSWGSRVPAFLKHAPKPDRSPVTPRRCRELLIAPRALLGRTRGKPQSSVTGMRVSNRAFQSRLCLDGLMRWTPAKFWLSKRILHSKPRSRLHQRPAQLQLHGWLTLCSWNHVPRALRRCGWWAPGIGTEVLGPRLVGDRDRPVLLGSGGAPVSGKPMVRATQPPCLPMARQDFYRTTEDWPHWAPQT